VRVALITGATGGLGQYLAMGLDKKGYRVIIHYFRNKQTAEMLRSQLRNSPLTFQADISSETEVARMASEFKEKVNRLDLLINNASVTRDALLLRLNEKDWDMVMAVNLRGVFNMVKHFSPFIISAGGGHIVNITSISGIKGRAGQAAYSASKSALSGFTLSLAKELSVYNIKVNNLVPGYLPTGMGIRSKTAIQKAKEESLLGRLSDPASVADFIAFLAGQEITGQTFCLETRV